MGIWLAKSCSAIHTIRRSSEIPQGSGRIHRKLEAEYPRIHLTFLVQFTFYALRSVDVSYKAILIKGVKDGNVRQLRGSYCIGDIVRSDVVVRDTDEFQPMLGLPWHEFD